MKANKNKPRDVAPPTARSTAALLVLSSPKASAGMAGPQLGLELLQRVSTRAPIWRLPPTVRKLVERYRRLAPRIAAGDEAATVELAKLLAGAEGDREFAAAAQAAARVTVERAERRKKKQRPAVENAPAIAPTKPPSARKPKKPREP